MAPHKIGSKPFVPFTKINIDELRVQCARCQTLCDDGGRCVMVVVAVWLAVVMPGGGRRCGGGRYSGGPRWSRCVVVVLVVVVVFCFLSTTDTNSNHGR